MIDIRNYVEKARKAGKYLKLIKHCQECKGNCHIPQCSNTKQLLQHCIPCADKSCAVPGCLQTNLIIKHSLICKLERKRSSEYGTPKLCLICYNCDCNSEPLYPVEPVFGNDGFAIPLPPKRLRRDSISGYDNYVVPERNQPMRERFSSI